MTYTLQTSIVATMIAFLALLGAGVASASIDDDEGPIVGKVKITESQALKIADDAYTGDGTLTDIELEMEGKTLVYAVEFTESDGNEVDVKLDAKTGKVVIIESDKTEGPDDEDEDGEEEDEGRVATMETLIRLLNQLLALLQAQQH